MHSAERLSLAVGAALLGCSSIALAQATRVIFVQPIQMTDNAGTVMANPDRVLFEAECDKIMAQAGIDIKFLPWNTYANTTYLNLANNAAFDSLISTSGHGQNANSNVCNMWFVQTLPPDDEGVNPLGLGRLNGNGTAIADKVITDNFVRTICHELGHNYGLEHNNLGAGAAAPLNLMTPAPDGGIHPHKIEDIFPDGLMAAQLSQQQIDRFLSRSPTKTIYTSTYNFASQAQGNWASAGNWDNNPSISAYPNLDFDKGIFNAVVPFGSVYLNQNIIVEKLTQKGGTVSTVLGFNQGPAYSLQVDDTFDFSGGTQAGQGVTTVARKLAISSTGTTTPQLSGRTLRMLDGCQGTMTGVGLAGSGSAALVLDANTDLSLSNSASFQRLSGSPVIQNKGSIRTDLGIYSIQWKFENNGAFFLANGATAQLSGTGGGTGSYFVGGNGAVMDFRSNYVCGSIGGFGTVTFSTGSVTISGDYDLDPGLNPAQAGSTIVKGGKALFNGAKTVVGNSLTLTSGEARFANAVTIPRLFISGSGISDEVSAANALTVTTEMKWDGPILSGAGVKTVNGNLEVKSGVLVNGMLNTKGVTTFVGPGQMYGGESAVWRNDGVFEMKGDFAFGILPPPLGQNPPPPGFDNRGTFTKTAGAGAAQFEWPMSNSGTMRVQSGKMQFTKGFSQSAGSTIVSAGATLESTDPIQLTGGVLGGGGTVKAPNIINNAILAPGESPGILTDDGAYTQSAGGALAIELGGLVVGDQYDRLVVTGGASLGGMLDVSLLFNYLPNPTDQFLILSAASITGTFSNTPNNTLTLANGKFGVLYNSNSVVLTNFVAIPEPAVGALVTVVSAFGLVRRRIARGTA